MIHYFDEFRQSSVSSQSSVPMSGSFYTSKRGGEYSAQPLAPLGRNRLPQREDPQEGLCREARRSTNSVTSLVTLFSRIPRGMSTAAGLRESSPGEMEFLNTFSPSRLFTRYSRFLSARSACDLSYFSQWLDGLQIFNLRRQIPKRETQNRINFRGLLIFFLYSISIEYK